MTALRQDVARLYREVCARGLNVGSSGNVSARAGLGMIITPSGVRGDTVDPADLVRMDFAGGHEGPPSAGDRTTSSDVGGAPALTESSCPA